MVASGTQFARKRPPQQKRACVAIFLDTITPPPESPNADRRENALAAHRTRALACSSPSDRSSKCHRGNCAHGEPLRLDKIIVLSEGYGSRFVPCLAGSNG